MFSFLKKLFGSAQERTLQKYRKTVEKINSIEKEYQALTDEQLLAKTDEFKKRIAQGETLDSLLPEAFAAVKNCCRRMLGTEVHVSGYNQKWDMVPYDVQLLGAIALHHGAIAEMQTGEGKTVTAAMPLYLHALTGKGVHIVTVNDYLAKRDCEWIGTIYRRLGLTTGVLQQEMRHAERKEIYTSDIVYGTASEFGFDYLRDNSMAMSADEQVQRGHYYALIDEVDSILIDEARTPLIISGPSPVSFQMYDKLQDGVAALVQLQRDMCQKIALDAKKHLERFTTDEDKEITLTDDEYNACQRLWLVSKGTPKNKILKRLKQNHDIRAAIDRWDLHYYKEQNKDLRAEALAQLYIIVEEKINEYELTEKGISAWIEGGGNADDFVMLDLGYELVQIDKDPSLTADQKLASKLELQKDDSIRKERAHNLRQLLRAHLMLEKDVDYIIHEGKIVIIDEHTGRMQPGRRFSDGLHQAIEAKEQVEIERETQTYATITLQNYFRMYERLSGMTGTAITEALEFKDIYKLTVLQIPTNRPCVRSDKNDEMYMTEREKYAAILREVQSVHSAGRPILLGTESVEISEKLSRLFKMNKLNHTVLNAKNHTKEAEIIAMAGQTGAITIATNMAGRGTDIKLGEGIADLGGLHVIGSTRHQSRRIDRQLRGRSGRQGDPGSSKFYISVEDPLMRLFATPSVAAWLQKFRPPEGEPISAGILNKSIETAQKRVESRNYTIRKHTLEYDDVMNKQRHEIYDFRNAILHTDSPLSLALESVDYLIHQAGGQFFSGKGTDGREAFRTWLAENAPVALEDEELYKPGRSNEELLSITASKVSQALKEKLDSEMAVIRENVPSEEEVLPTVQSMIRSIMLRTVDHLWQQHLLQMDHLRNDVHIRALGQKDPLMEFKHEAFRLFGDFARHLREDIIKALFRVRVVIGTQNQEDEVEEYLNEDEIPEDEFELSTGRSLTDEFEELEEPVIEIDPPHEPFRGEKHSGRNDLCPCGSGRKYKRCCGVHAIRS